MNLSGVIAAVWRYLKIDEKELAVPQDVLRSQALALWSAILPLGSCRSPVARWPVD